MVVQPKSIRIRTSEWANRDFSSISIHVAIDVPVPEHNVAQNTGRDTFTTPFWAGLNHVELASTTVNKIAAFVN